MCWCVSTSRAGSPPEFQTLGMAELDLPRSHTIRESSHRLLNPLTPEKLAVIGQALHLRAGTSVLDLASGKGEMLCTWARDHEITGTGVDISTVFTDAARARADELGVGDRLAFVHADASAFVASEPVDLAALHGCELDRWRHDRHHPPAGA
jgi:SAM-dependent methyltransferase